MNEPPAHDTRLERILGVALADDAMRQWPHSGEVINGRQRIDGRVYRNVTVADLRDGHAIRVTDYWGEPFEVPRLEGVARRRARHAAAGGFGRQSKPFKATPNRPKRALSASR